MASRLKLEGDGEEKREMEEGINGGEDEKSHLSGEGKFGEGER